MANVVIPAGEIIVTSFKFSNDFKDFKTLLKTIQSSPRKDHLEGMEDTVHYGDNLRVFLLDRGTTVAMINPISTNAIRKAAFKSTKTDREDTKYIGIVLLNPMLYRIVDKSSLETHEMRELIGYHHSILETCARYKAQLQKDFGKVFPEFNSLFSGHYESTYMRILEQFQSTDTIHFSY